MTDFKIVISCNIATTPDHAEDVANRLAHYCYCMGGNTVKASLEPQGAQ